MAGSRWLALAILSLECTALLSLTLGLSFTGMLGGYLWRKPAAKKKKKLLNKRAAAAVEAPTQQAPLSVPTSSFQPAPSLDTATAPLVASEPSAPAPTAEPSAPAPASEPSAPPSLGAQGSCCLLPHEVSFTFSNALAESSSNDESDGEALGAVDEGSEEVEGDGGSFFECQEAAAEAEEDGFDECGSLVFEPSSSGMPGVRMMPRHISGLAERTEPTSPDQRSAPLLVSSYDSRYLEIENGRVKDHEEAEPAYLSLALDAAARSPSRRSPTRSPTRSQRPRGGGTLGPLASFSSFGSLSPGASSAAL